LDKINRIIPALNSIGLPGLAVKLQIVEVYINFSKKNTALSALNEFEAELVKYMPAILQEYSRLKAYHNYIKIQPARLLSM